MTAPAGLAARHGRSNPDTAPLSPPRSTKPTTPDPGAPTRATHRFDQPRRCSQPKEGRAHPCPVHRKRSARSTARTCPGSTPSPLARRPNPRRRHDRQARAPALSARSTRRGPDAAPATHRVPTKPTAAMPSRRPQTGPTRLGHPQTPLIAAPGRPTPLAPPPWAAWSSHRHLSPRPPVRPTLAAPRRPDCRTQQPRSAQRTCPSSPPLFTKSIAAPQDARGPSRCF